MAECTRLVIAA